MDIEYVNESSLTTFWSRIKSVLITPLNTSILSIQATSNANKENLQSQLNDLSSRILALENNSGGSGSGGDSGGGSTTINSRIDETNMIIYGYVGETLDLGWTPDHFRAQNYEIFGASSNTHSLSDRITMSGSKMSFIGTANKNWSSGISGSVNGLESNSEEPGCWFWTYKTSSIKYRTIIQ